MRGIELKQVKQPSHLWLHAGASVYETYTGTVALNFYAFPNPGPGTSEIMRQWQKIFLPTNGAGNLRFYPQIEGSDQIRSSALLVAPLSFQAEEDEVACTRFR
jgi:hypothetical protein